MNKSPVTASRATVGSKLRLTLLLLVAGVVLSGCFFGTAYRFNERTGTVPWWCQGAPDLNIDACLSLSANLDVAVAFAQQYWTVADLPAGASAYGATNLGGYAYLLPGSGNFNPMVPNLLIYEPDNASDSRLVAIGWLVASASGAPEGFPGDRDQWTFTGLNDNWILGAWVIRGYEYHPDVFASTTHPCLVDGVTLASTADACFQASHTQPLEVLVTNDDGYDAPGIDALVEALVDDPNDPADGFVAGITVQVVAPLTQQSGQGDNLTPGGAPAASTGLATASGFPVLAAVHGTPGDSAIWALDTLNLSPGIVLSGINSGQNLANIGSRFSGTVGAARTALRRAASAAIAVSADLNEPDWPVSADATVALLEQWRLGEAGMPMMELPNINIPTCAPGTSLRGTLVTPVGVDLMGRGYADPADCSSVKPVGDIFDDLDAFQNGFISIADMGKNKPPNYP
ncbi:MAG: hypothetical protein KDI09_05470 [Halioglobus sp.]|nr:hypothetical protein [Halioglobus sp.]